MSDDDFASVIVHRSDGQRFQEKVHFFVVCLAGIYFLIRLLIELRSILEPFLWALFLVLTWKPAVDYVENWILSSFICSLIQAPTGDPSYEHGRKGMNFAEPEEMQSLVDEIGSSAQEHGDSIKRNEPEQEQEQEQEGGMRRSVARGVAILLVFAVMMLVMSCLFFWILESAKHMRNNWSVYERGVTRFVKNSFKPFEQISTSVFQRVPKGFKTKYDDVTNTFLRSVQEWFYRLLGEFVNNVSSLIFGMMITMLYMLFWLCSPVPIHSAIYSTFRRYILMKTLVCFGFGSSCGLLLAFLGVDLAAVFALLTFFLNYIPEVGPFVAMMLPCPVILFDSRVEKPLVTLFVAVASQVALKFVFSNIIEVKLIESDKKLRMHPVMILFSVATFGAIWGPTGMLLSVPTMALLKLVILSPGVPSSYRDPLLVLLEGDRQAPQKYRHMCKVVHDAL